MQAFRIAVFGILFIVGLASPGFALTLSHLPSDAAYLALAPVLSFVAEGRIGDRGGAATFELDLGKETAAPATSEQYNWQSGQSEPFTIAYEAASGLVRFTLGGHTLQYIASGTLTDVFLRTRAVNEGSSVTLGDLALDGLSVGDGSSCDAVSEVDYLRIEGGDLADGFVLTGTAVLQWTGTAPTQSRLAFQIKVGTTSSSVGVQPVSWESVKALYR
jgi:hypothetical protein